MIVEKIEMRLFAIFLILGFQLSHIFAFPPNPPELSSQANQNLKGYECGNVFITYTEIKKALSLAIGSIGKGYRYPQVYRGQLYSESKFEEYFLYPVKNGRQLLPNVKRDFQNEPFTFPGLTISIGTNPAFFVVLTRNSNKEIDVVAKTTTGDYTKCIQRHNTHVGPSHSVLEIPNGYLCGHIFFTDEAVHETLLTALTKIAKNPKCPPRYVGLLYPEDSEHVIWPITRENFLYKNSHIGPFFLVLNNEKQIVDVVVRGYGNNFLRCIRSRKLPKASSSDPHNKLFVQPPKSGYSCGKTFFDDDIIDENAKTVESKAGNAIKSKLPIKYSGPPFNEQCLIWPLLQDGSLSKRGHRGPYRLILTSEYKVLSVAMYVKGKFIACERKTIAGKRNHDTSDYHCREEIFSHRSLVTAAEAACVKMKAITNNMFPARCEGPGFELDGPYFTYPVFANSPRSFIVFAGPNRVVINANCEVVGALTTLELTGNGGIITKKLVKCHRLDDGPLPPGFFSADAETVFERKIRH